MKNSRCRYQQVMSFTLRGHTARITAIEVGKPGTVITGDDSGEIRQWDLVTRRSVHVVKQTAAILGIKCREYVFVLSKDYMMRIYDDRWNRVYEVPVNTLNFAQFGLLHGEQGYFLWTVNTTVHENVDIYLVKPQSQELTRLGNNLSAGKHGIVMQFQEVEDGCLVGYEDGTVVKMDASCAISPYKKLGTQPVLSMTSGGVIGGVDGIMPGTELLTQVTNVSSIAVLDDQAWCVSWDGNVYHLKNWQVQDSWSKVHSVLSDKVKVTVCALLAPSNMSSGNRRLDALSKQTWLFIGSDDGTIQMKNVI